MGVYEKGIVASGHRSVSEAAARMLGEGGNAFDGVVAAGFASTVAEQTLTSLGGGGFLLGHSADQGQEMFFDFGRLPYRALAFAVFGLGRASRCLGQ